MSSWGRSIWDKSEEDPTTHKGKLYGEPKPGCTCAPYRTKGTKIKPNNLDTTNQSQYLRTRMKADDSDAVNMSDRKLGKGIRDFTKE